MRASWIAIGAGWFRCYPRRFWTWFAMRGATSAERDLLRVRRQRAAIDVVCVKLKKRLAELGVETVDETSNFADLKEELGGVGIDIVAGVVAKPQGGRGRRKRSPIGACAET